VRSRPKPLWTPLGVAAGVLAAAAVTAQSPQRPLFRGGTMLVNVDAYPMRGGRLVEGLTPADFQVTEDGVPQRVEFFEYIHIDPFAGDLERRDPNTQEEGFRLIADPHRRVFVTYFDIYHLATTGARDMRTPVRDFLERVIGPTDYVAAMTPDVSAKDLLFGQRLETIEAAVAEYWRKVYEVTSGGLQWPQNAQEAFLENCYINRTRDAFGNKGLLTKLFARLRLDEVLGGLRDVTARLSTLREERTSLLLFSGGWTLERQDPTLQPYVWGPFAGDIKDRLRGAKTSGVPPSPAACDTELMRLASIDFSQRFRDLVEFAARQNVSFNTIDPTGLRIYDLDMTQQQPNPGFPPDPQAPLEPLRTLAERTGGTAIVATNDIATPMKRLAENAASYYLLGYYSTNTNLAGKYRKIGVEVKAPDVKVSARKGYVGSVVAPPAPPAPAPSAATTAVADELAALALRGRPVGLVLDASAGAADVAVVVELAPDSAADWREGGGLHVDLRGPGGISVGSADARLEAGAQAALMIVPRGAAAGPWRASVALRGAAGTLTNDIDVKNDSADLFGVPLVFRSSYATQAPLVPVSTRRFRRTERVHVEWEPHAALTNRIARVLDRRGQPLPLEVTLTERGTADRPILAADLNLAPFGAGDYVIELTGDAAGRTGLSLVAIRVDR